MVTQVSEGEEKEKSQEQLLDERIARPACGADPSKVKALLLKYKHVFPKVWGAREQVCRGLEV